PASILEGLETEIPDRGLRVLHNFSHAATIEMAGLLKAESTLATSCPALNGSSCGWVQRAPGESWGSDLPFLLPDSRACRQASWRSQHSLSSALAFSTFAFIICPGFIWFNRLLLKARDGRRGVVRPISAGLQGARQHKSSGRWGPSFSSSPAAVDGKQNGNV